MRLKHEELSLKDGLVGQRKVNGHLVTIEVSVEGCTCEWVELDSLAFYHAWLESLNTKSVECWRTVEQDGMTLHDIFEDVPYHWVAAVNNLLSRLNCLHDTALYELADHEWLVEFGCHELWYTTLAHVELWTNDDDRTG